MTCSHCNGTVIRESDPYDGPRMVCLRCGRSPRIHPLGEWLLEAERRRDVRPTDQY